MSNAIQSMQDRLVSALQQTGVTGASLAVWDGYEMHTAVAGQRNSVTGDPVTTDTLMHIGSITKIFNTTLVLQLVDDGLIGLDDLVAKHLPDLALGSEEALRAITVEMLVNHTSGINCMALPDHGPDLERIQDAIDRFADKGLLHAPGAGPSYCNSATVIAGYLVQRLRGESWYSLVKKRLFEPLGLKHALVDLTDLPKYRVSVGDLTDLMTGRPYQTSRPYLSLSFAPAGATIMMSASDLVEFAIAHLNAGVGRSGARILSELSVALMQRATATILEPQGWSWGLGWNLVPGGLLFHGGSGPGVHSVLYVHPESGRAVAMLTNRDNGSRIHAAVLGPILAEWTGLDWSNGLYPKPDITLPRNHCLEPDERKGFVGTYANNMWHVEVVERESGLGFKFLYAAQLYDNTNKNAEIITPMVPLSDNLFEVNRPGFPGNVIRFMPKDQNGMSPGLGFHLHILPRQQ